jgi:hypothetical protein
MNNGSITRREWLRTLMGAGLAITAIAARRTAGFAPADTIAVYKDPNCGCCRTWIKHLETNGFHVTASDRNDMAAIKDSLGVPAALRTCHTAVVGKLIIEGHVPAADIRKAMTNLPKGVIGLAVPGMPAGSPGMEMGSRADRYDVLAFDVKGAVKVFATHG